MKIVFIGTPEFGAIILEELIKSKYKPDLVITLPDKKVGRKQILTPSPVKIIAQKYDIPIEQLREKERIKNLRPDLIVVASYGKILPKEILNIPKYGCLNVHPSLLPKYRGATPIQSAILNGDKETGATIMLMDEKMDHGPTIINSKFKIKNSKLKIQNSKLTYKGLHNKLADLGAKLLVDTIPKWLKGEIKPIPQEESKATYTKILKKEDGKINWNKTAESLEKEIRAFHLWPGSYAIFEEKGKPIKIKILEAEICRDLDKNNFPIGKIIEFQKNQIKVKCGKDFLIIKKIQQEGKKEMLIQDFLRGHQNFINTILK